MNEQTISITQFVQVSIRFVGEVSFSHIFIEEVIPQPGSPLSRHVLKSNVFANFQMLNTYQFFFFFKQSFSFVTLLYVFQCKLPVVT